MAKTLSTIRSEVYEKIQETSTNSHFTTTEIDAFINEGIQKVAVISHHPRKFDAGTQAVVDTADYDLPSDFLFLVGAYFGDSSISGDLVPLKVIREENIKYLDPAWLDRNSASRGTPLMAIMIDRDTIRLHPRPDTASSASGKMLKLFYAYLPATLSSDSGNPDLPTPYHDVLKYYAAGLAYAGRLANPQMAGIMFGLFEKELAQRVPATEMEAEENLRFQWGFIEE